VAGVEHLEVCGAAFDGVGIAAVIGSARSSARRVIARAAQTHAAAAR
jgi:hypothetical protein